jgi:hypothetical protein
LYRPAADLGAVEPEGMQAQGFGGGEAVIPILVWDCTILRRCGRQGDAQAISTKAA